MRTIAGEIRPPSHVRAGSDGYGAQAERAHLRFCMRDDHAKELYREKGIDPAAAVLGDVRLPPGVPGETTAANARPARNQAAAALTDELGADARTHVPTSPWTRVYSASFARLFHLP
jgi:hypothetical protein